MSKQLKTALITERKQVEFRIARNLRKLTRAYRAQAETETQAEQRARLEADSIRLADIERMLRAA